MNLYSLAFIASWRVRVPLCHDILLRLWAFMLRGQRCVKVAVFTNSSLDILPVVKFSQLEGTFLQKHLKVKNFMEPDTCFPQSFFHETDWITSLWFEEFQGREKKVFQALEMQSMVNKVETYRLYVCKISALYVLIYMYVVYSLNVKPSQFLTGSP